MSKTKVYLTEGDGIGWAVDEDSRLIRMALDSVVELVDLDESEVVHSLWWEPLMLLPDERLAGKRILCHMAGEPFRYLKIPGHRKALAMVGRWLTRSSQAAEEMRSLGIIPFTIPYLVDIHTFRPLPRHHPDLEALRRTWNIPRNTYLIGSFQRDTEGTDLKSPKLVKGPDVLLEIVSALQKRVENVHLVLGGPRRHWLLRQAEERGIPFTYVGIPTQRDDMHDNTLSRSTLNILYNLVNVCIIASRSEGGPHAILEAAAAKCKVVSTAVGIAPDILDPKCIFSSVPEAVFLIEHDIHHDMLQETTITHYRNILEHHTPETVAPRVKILYDDIGAVPVYRGQCIRDVTPDVPPKKNKPMRSHTQITIGLWHTFFEPPYGGGNQFMLALRKALLKKGVTIRENQLDEQIDAYILNSIHFDVDRFLDFSTKHRLTVIHRIDGPIHLIRGFDREKDELCYRLNEQFATATVIQSAWTFQRIVEMGYQPVNPVIIHNAVDSDIFHARGRIPFDRKRKIRLISTSWSNNPRKGGPLYKWLEEHLDWNRFEYTFVGNVSESFRQARHIPPVSSEELANLLRQHDIYLTASRNDPCSNALIEALACGLPALYLHDGGHPELVGTGGLPFHDEGDIFLQLEKLVDNYEIFQRLIVIPSLDDVVRNYPK